MHTSVPALRTTRQRFALLGVAAAVSVALSACSSPLDMPTAGSSGGGDHGSNGSSWAPPISMPVPDPPNTYPSPNLDHGCADGASANGFPCVSVPGTGDVIYPGPDPDPRP